MQISIVDAWLDHDGNAIDLQIRSLGSSLVIATFTFSNIIHYCLVRGPNIFTVMDPGELTG